MTPEQFVQEWERCTPWLQAALDSAGQTFSLAQIRDAVQAGNMQFWPALDSAVVTQVIRGDRGAELNIYLGGGRLDTLRDMLPTLEWFGRKMGCTVCTILGRRGWERTFLTRESGYRPVAVMLGKELPYGEDLLTDERHQTDDRPHTHGTTK